MNLSVSNSQGALHRKLDQIAATGHASIVVDVCLFDGLAGGESGWSFAVYRRLDAYIVIGLELGELSLEVTSVKRQYMIEKLSPRGADEALNKGMRNRIVEYRFDFIDLQNWKIRFPAVEFEKGIVIRTDVFRSAPTERCAFAG